MPRSRLGFTSASRITSRIARVMTCITSSAPCLRGVELFSQPMIFPSGRTRPAAIFVPPTSTPM